MKKGGDNLQTLTKTVLVILILLSVPLALGLMFLNWAVIGDLPNIRFFDTQMMQTISQNYLFWGGLVLTVILIVGLITILTWPKSFQLYQLTHNDGQLRVTKRAIDNFTLSALRHEPFISDPRVTTKLSRRRLKIKIHGTLRPSKNAALQSKQFTMRLERDLKQLLGMDHNRKIDIRLTDFDRNRQAKQARVV